MAAKSGHVHILMGEVNVIHAAMKRAQRWNSQEDRNQLLEKVLTLKHILSACEDLDQIAAKTYLLPFLDIIRAEDTTVLVTTLALTTVQKILTYRLLDHRSKVEIASVVEQISEAVTHARFTGSDPASDEGVLMKILHVLKCLLLSAPGNLLTNESVCEIAGSLFRMSLEPRLSALLRNISDTFLIEIIQHLFTRLPELVEGNQDAKRTLKKLRHHVIKRRAPSPPPSSQIQSPSAESELSATGPDPASPDVSSVISDDNSTVPVSLSEAYNEPASLIIPGAVVPPEEPTAVGADHEAAVATAGSWNIGEAMAPSPSEESSGEEEPEDTVDKDIFKRRRTSRDEYTNERGIKFRAALPRNDESGAHIPYGLPAIHEILRFVVTLIRTNEKTERNADDSELYLNLGLKVLSTAVETSAPIIPRYSTLMTLVRDEFCRNMVFLLQTDRLSIFTLTLRLAFFVFESMRDHLKLQLEHFLTVLMEVVATESPRVTVEHKEASLDFLLRLWRLPNFITELYLNYDCDLYCGNLFEEFVKLLSKHAFPVSGLNVVHLLSLDCLLMAVEKIDRNCQKALQGTDLSKNEISANDYMELQLLKVKKKLLSNGTELFNQKPAKGIQCLQEHKILSDPVQPTEVAKFLRENPRLDKAMIGEYISNRKNTTILEAFVKSFDFAGKRIDEALREYLEAFRLPGESPLISHIMEHFAAHWQLTCGSPFLSQDSAFIMSYAVIMLNTSLHNETAKKQNIPNTVKDFQKQLTKQNKLQGQQFGEDFDPAMLEQIHENIKREEIVMPAERIGRVKDLYLWKILLRRCEKSHFRTISSGVFDKELFGLLWGPTVAALSYAFDKTGDDSVIRKTISGFKKCAFIAASPRIMSCEIFDNIVVTLCKYSSLQSSSDPISLLPVSFGQNTKAQLATKTVFMLAHQHGDILRDGWKNIIDCIAQLFRARLLPEYLNQADDFGPHKVVSLSREEPVVPKQESGLFNAFYNFITSDSSSRSATTIQEESELKNIAKACIEECKVGDLVIDSKFLQNESLRYMVDALIAAGKSGQRHQEGNPAAANPAMFLEEQSALICLETLVKVLIENRDRLGEQGVKLWPIVHDYFHTILLQESRTEMSFLFERAVVGLLRLAVRFLPRDHDRELQLEVMHSLRLLQGIRPDYFGRLSRQISFALHNLFETNATANIRASEDWRLLFNLLECAGAGIRNSAAANKEKDLPKSESQQLSRASPETDIDRGYTSDSELYDHQSISPAGSSTWLMVGKEGEVVETGNVNDSLVFPYEFSYHDKDAFFVAVDSLKFLIRDTGQITTENVSVLVHALCVFAEASMNGRAGISGRVQRAALKRMDRRVQQKIIAEKRNAITGKNKAASTPASPADEDGADYLKESLLLLDLMHNVHVRVASVYRSSRTDVNLWTEAWYPLLRGIARICCDSRKAVRMDGLTWLNRALLIPDLQSLAAQQWEECIHKVLFPLLLALRSDVKRHSSMEETITRAAPLMCKVFLQHLSPLVTLPTFVDLWMSILDLMEQLLKSDSKSDLVKEAVLESIKNMLLVMSTAGLFQDFRNALWDRTRGKVDSIVPGLTQHLLEITSMPPTERPTLIRPTSPDPSPPPVTFLFINSEPAHSAEPPGLPLLLDPGILQGFQIPVMSPMHDGRSTASPTTPP